MTDWIQRDYGKAEIDRAGASLVPWWTNLRATEPTPEIAQSFQVLQNWRASHAMPLLTFRMGLSKRARRVQPDALVAQRLKRFTSVMDKLVREHTMKLSQMQDLGGCRAIVRDVPSVDRLYELYRGPQDLFESEGALKSYDYIRSPKPDGYRGIHLVGRYRDESPRTNLGMVIVSKCSCGHSCNTRGRPRLRL
jgi:hypothetical protein